MKPNKISKTTPEFILKLKQYTKARVALGRCGSSMPTQELLKLKLDHARAIDAVFHPLNTAFLHEQLETQFGLEVLTVESAAKDRDEYLQRPDLGRCLSESSKTLMEENVTDVEYDICIVISDGLSATAIEKNILPFFKIFLPAVTKFYSLAPVIIAEQARVALADEVAELLKVQMVIHLIGERPGLKSPDSMGIYMTYRPYTGITDERRNCISNVRQDGLSYALASSKLMYLIEQAIKRKLSGVDLKDEQDLALSSD